MAPPMAADPFDMADSVIWVTGSSRGVGRGVAEHLAARGATVVVHARSADALDDDRAALGSAAAAVVEELVARAGATTTVGRIGEPAGVAMACQHLLSDAAAPRSGAVLVADGGPTEGPTQRIQRALGDRPG